MANKRKDGPHWVKAWIADLSMLTDSFRDMNTGAVNFEALGKEEYLFRMALSRKDFSLSNRAKKVWEEAVGPYNQRITAANKKSPQDAPNGNAGVDVTDAGNGAASKSPTSCDTLTADGDTREDSRGRYAPPSCSPEDGNPAETAPSHGGSVASLEARQGQARESQRRAGADSVRGTPLHSATARPRASFRNKEEFMQWAIDSGLDAQDASDCWEATLERGGLTKDGKKVENICAYAVKWCRTRKKNRETA